MTTSQVGDFISDAQGDDLRSSEERNRKEGEKDFDNGKDKDKDKHKD